MVCAATSISSQFFKTASWVTSATTSWAIAKKAADGDAPPGFQTPSMVYGADFILDFDGVDRIDLDGSP